MAEGFLPLRFGNEERARPSAVPNGAMLGPAPVKTQAVEGFGSARMMAGNGQASRLAAAGCAGAGLGLWWLTDRLRRRA